MSVSEPYPVTKSEKTDLFRNLGLLKSKSELLCSMWHQGTWNKLMILWNNYWDLASTINITGNSTEIWMLFLSCLDCQVDITRTCFWVVVFFVNCTSETVITWRGNWPLRQSLEAGRKNGQYSFFQREFVDTSSHQDWWCENFREAYGQNNNRIQVCSV